MAAEWIVRLAAVYAGMGLVFAVVFVAIGVQRVDPVARGAPWKFRLLIIPGCAGLWPILALRWLRVRRQGAEA